MGLRNDAEKRAANEALKPGDLWAAQVQWMTVVREARRRLSTKGVDRPAGLEPGGELWLHRYMIAATGYAKWNLWYRYDRETEGIKVGRFVTEYLPDEVHVQKMRPIQTHGRTVVVNQKVTGDLARPVRVLIDAEGLPVPVDPVIWAAMGLEG